MSWAPIAAEVGGSLLGGIFGGPQQPQYTPEQLAAFRFQMQMARMLRQYGQGIPGSSPGETAALAQDRALAGQNMAAQQSKLASGFNLNTEQSSLPTFLSNLGNNQAATFGGIDTAHLLQSLNNRQQALGEAARTARGAASSLGGSYTQPTPNFGSIFGGLANQLSMQNIMSQYGQGGGNSWANGVPGGMTTAPGEFMGPVDQSGVDQIGSTFGFAGGFPGMGMGF